MVSLSEILFFGHIMATRSLCGLPEKLVLHIDKNDPEYLDGRKFVFRLKRPLPQMRQKGPLANDASVAK